MDYDAIIEKIAEGLDTTITFASQEIYPILLRQAYIDGTVKLIGSLLIFSVIITLSYKGITRLIEEERKIDKEENEGLNSEWAPLIFLFLIFIAIPGVIAGTTMLFNSITPLLNPNYYIIEEILKHL